MAADRHQAQAYPLRLPEDLKARVAASAAEQGRSLNSEIVARLEAGFKMGAPEMSFLVAKLEHDLMKGALDHSMQTMKLNETALGLLIAASALKHNLISGNSHEVEAWIAEAREILGEHGGVYEEVEHQLNAAKVSADRLIERSTRLGLIAPSPERLTDAAIIRREPKQPVLSQGPRSRKR